ncbi:phosphatidate cytidylyltransferase [Leptotrichia shahii]|uniref:phosphatidate cytidylyltransferase n=1 Tax=Leptotrichia shahii TaxID=157691 RepID=UPI0028D2B1E7|nr:phosphatidate cytidylyltransferase [Leptotrichia shahii]
MLDLLKNDLKKFAIFVGSVSFGMLSYNFNFNFPNIMYLFVYFLIALVIYCFVGKTLKVGFENAIVETLLIVTIYMLPLDTSFKSFLYGVFIYISISSVFNKIKEVGKIKEPVIGGLYLLIALMIGLILYRYPGSIMYFKGMENINNEMLVLFSLVSLIGSI